VFPPDVTAEVDGLGFTVQCGVVTVPPDLPGNYVDMESASINTRGQGHTLASVNRLIGLIFGMH